MLKLKHLISLSFVLFLPFLALAQGYNEIHNSDNQPRLEYREIFKLWQVRYARQEAKFLRESRDAFHGDNALDAMPRLIPDYEYARLKKGVEQRAQALLAFLKDHYSGRKAYAQAGVISAATVDRIVARSGEAAYQGAIDPSIISFLYGPDIIRDTQGQWRVIEDNSGFIGGVGDLRLAQKYMIKKYPELKNYNMPSADDFYTKLAESYKRRAQEFGGKAIFLTFPEYAADNEDARIANIMIQNGIERITPATKKQLIIKKNGVYLTSQKNGLNVFEKVGFIYMNGEHSWMDPLHPASRESALLDAAEELITSGETSLQLRTQLVEIMNNPDPVTHMPDLKKLETILPADAVEIDQKIAKKYDGFVEAILQKKVGSNYSPGVDFVGDKEFYVYVEDLIRFYLHQEPILRNIETERFASAQGVLREDLLARIFSDFQQYVIKKVDGRGGDSVWVGPKVTPSEQEALIQMIRRNPDYFIVQRFTPLSEMNKNIVDVRVISAVSDKDIIVTETPWGRGLPKSGNGKVNLSDKGREVSVLVVRPPTYLGLSCRQIFY
jgi:uncharacterized circularly permuted ATP-grasp superfamily protein